MPWTPADATKHSKKATTPQQQAQWARVANSVRAACMKGGGDETKCDASAVQQANGVIAKGMEEREMPDIWELTESVFEVAFASLTGDTNVKEADRLRLLESYKTDFDKLQEAEWTGKFVNDLPDSSFALILPGGKKDTDGKTEPRSLRKLPYKDASGAVDVAHLRNALARVSQVKGATPAQIASAQAKLKSASKGSLKTAEAAQPETVRELLQQARDLQERALELLDETVQEVAESNLAESAGGGIISLAESGVETVAPLTLDIAIIQPGFGNKRDNNYYAEDMLRRDAPGAFSGIKMYETDHKPNEKSTRTWVSTITDVTGFTERGEPIGRVAVHDEGFAKRLIALNEAKDASGNSLLSKMACSILAKGRTRKGTIDGRKANIVEAITSASSVDWVTKAGAGGRALNLAESAKEEVQEVNDNEVKQDGEQQPDEEPQEEPTPETTPDATPEPEATPTEAEPVQEVFLNEADIAPILAEAKLPEQAKARLQVGQYENDDALKTAVQAEADYIKAVTGAGKPVMVQGRTPATQPRTLAERNEAVDSVNDRWI